MNLGNHSRIILWWNSLSIKDNHSNKRGQATLKKITAIIYKKRKENPCQESQEERP